MEMVRGILISLKNGSDDLSQILLVSTNGEIESIEP